MNFIDFFSVGVALFTIALFGIILNKKSVLTIVMCIELALLSINFCFLSSSVFIDDRVGQIVVLFVLIVAAAETSIGLAIIISFYRLKGTTSTAFAEVLNG
jgi:NADH-quinone oxidoreductase subunit K